MTDSGTSSADGISNGSSRSLGSFEFECGERLPELEVAYETHGEFTGDNAVLVCHALTGSHRVTGAVDGQGEGWWDEVVGPGKPIDTHEQFVIAANVPGSCYGTTGPTSTNPETGEPYGSDFPTVTVGDWTRAQRRLLDDLGIDRLRAVIGGSVGGMNALEWVKRYPDRVERVIPVATAARLDPQLLGLSAVARRAITSDPVWQGGDYYPDHPDSGLALARQLGHITYLSKESMDEKFGRDLADCRPRSFPSSVGENDGQTADFAADSYRDVESYLDYQAQKFVKRFDANSYLHLTNAMENYDLAGDCDSDAEALSKFDGEALVVSFSGDWHFTVEQSDHLADAFRRAGVEVTHRSLHSNHGHDAFLAEPELVGPPIRRFLSNDAGRFAPVHASLFAQ
ncbi:homoserine O-acetyltransferase [Haladaptatus sp. R4]|uniref:homoserine O-acetyltransferase MetX n=1 Tax=Haladaptatus sp. R4 TaxID=1679489 RepID=UPI0007B4AECD|nr:homoserine O-acetyltransferase [Haladaptatus sp. R4]KZN25328.1 homoserine O-acetyltransferase [Haladaptatus sp. R4]